MDKQFDLLLSPPGTAYWRDEQEEEERARERGGAGEGKQKERERGGDREDKRPCWGRDGGGGINTETKKKGGKSLLLFVRAQPRLFLSFLACLSVCARRQFGFSFFFSFFFFAALICVPFLPVSTLALPSFVHTSTALFPSFLLLTPE